MPSYYISSMTISADYSIANNTQTEIPFNQQVEAYGATDVSTTNHQLIPLKTEPFEVSARVWVDGAAGETNMEVTLYLKKSGNVVAQEKTYLSDEGTARLTGYSETCTNGAPFTLEVKIEGNATKKTLGSGSTKTLFQIRKYSA